MNQSTPHPSICEASGWWAVYRRDDHTTWRERIAAWMTVYVSTEDAEYHYMQAMVPGDGPELIPADRNEAFSYLWHDGDSWCYCGSDPRPYWETDDIYWCRECASEIPR